jgi:hypothetical protein
VNEAALLRIHTLKGIDTMTGPDMSPVFTEHKLRKVLEGQVLRLADTSFAVVARHRRHRLIHLDLEADDGSHSTLIGIPGARVRLRESATPIQQ